MFSGSSNPMELLTILSDYDRCRKSNMAAAKPEVLISQFVNKLLDFQLPVWYDSIVSSSVGLLDPEHIGVALEIAFIFCLQTEI